MDRRDFINLLWRRHKRQAVMRGQTDDSRRRFVNHVLKMALAGTITWATASMLIQRAEALRLYTSGHIDLDKQASLTTPPSGFVRLGAKADGRLYSRDDAGIESALEALPDISSYRRVGTAAPERWYTSPCTGTAMTTGAPTANVLRAIPFPTPKRIKLDRIAINVTTLLAGKQRVGICADDGNLYPAGLVSGTDVAELDTGTAGVKANTIDVTLNGGKLYWLIIVGNAAPTIRCFAVGSLIPILGIDSALGTAWGLGYSVSYTYAALPATFPAGGAVISAVPIPAIFVRGAP